VNGGGGGEIEVYLNPRICGGVGLHVPCKVALMGKEHEMVLGIDTNGSFFAGRNRYNGSPFNICRFL
jgi:hypothetical protein